MLAGAGLLEEGGEGIVDVGGRLLVGGHLSVGLNAVLEAVELPTGVAHLDAGLADVDGDAFAHDEEETRVEGVRDNVRSRRAITRE